MTPTSPQYESSETIHSEDSVLIYNEINLAPYKMMFPCVLGLGLGLIYLPLIVMVGFWFDKRRAIAMGITTSGM